MKYSPAKLGFTLIEMIVSLAVFAGVVTISVGALLVLVDTSNQLQGEQSIMTNLSFALDSMTREIRTGTRYYCSTRSNFNSNPNVNVFVDGNDLDAIPFMSGQSEFQDCSGNNIGSPNALHGIMFIESGDSITATVGVDRILYYFNRNTGQMYRRVGTENAVPITADDIFIHNVEFFVTGSEPLTNAATQDDQASVTIFIEASDGANTPPELWYRLQTTVTQRSLDI